MFRLVREASRDIPLCVVDSSTPNAKIGRDPKTCAVPLGTKAVAVSREHAELQWSSSGVTLVDTSSFGTLVDGVKILKSSKLLKGGELLRIGQENFVLEKVEEVRKVPQSNKPVQTKPAVQSSITSYLTKKSTILREESDPAEISVRKILATETPSESQESQKALSQSQSRTVRKPVRGPRRVNPLFDFDEEEESILDNAKGKVLAEETPSDSVPSQRVTAPSAPSASAVPSAPPPAPSPAPPARAPVTTVTQPQPASATVEKKKKVSLFAKTSQRPKTQKPIVLDDDDDIMEVGVDVSPSNGGGNSQWDARPSVPRTRSRTTANNSMAGPSSRGVVSRMETSSRNSSDDFMEAKASAIPTQVLPPSLSARRQVAPKAKDEVGGFGSEPPRKKPKSLFAELEKKKKMMQNNRPREKTLLDEDDNGVLNIRYDYVPPKQVIGERAYSTMENLRAMDQMGRDAKARFESRHGLDKLDEMESQYPSVEELTSILCSSRTEEQPEEEEKEEGVERVGRETLPEETKSQLVRFCDSLVVSQPSSDSMASLDPSQPKGFKKFKKARQGRFATQATGFSSIIGGSDLVDFRDIHI